MFPFVEEMKKSIGLDIPLQKILLLISQETNYSTDFEKTLSGVLFDFLRKTRGEGWIYVKDETDIFDLPLSTERRLELYKERIRRNKLYYVFEEMADQNCLYEISLLLDVDSNDIIKDGYGALRLLSTYASFIGNFELVKLLHNRNRRFSRKAMNMAAEMGHLDILKFLHENRGEGFTEKAIRKAIRNGHNDVVSFLLANFSPQ